MNKKAILALDQGTTSSRAILFDQTGKMLAMSQQEFGQSYPQPGWVEHDAMEIWRTQLTVARQALAQAGLLAEDIAGIGLTNQRETTVVWNRASGMPIYPAIVWQDRRTAAFCDQLKQRGLQDTIRERTGLTIDAYFSGSKLKWILDHVPDARHRAQAGDLAFGTIDSWLIWNLTQGKVHATDLSNASRTMLFNIHTLEWDDTLLALMDVPRAMLPQVCASSGVVGESPLLGATIPIAGIAGDQQAALFGQQCTQPGMLKNTYGTGCFLMMQTGEQAIPSRHNLLTTIAWQIDGRVHYALEGSVFIGGAVIKWLRDGLQLIHHASEVEALARQVSDSGGVVLVPAFTGMGAPHWNQNARGTLFGATLGTTRAHIARAALESIAYQTMDVVKAMEADADRAVSELRVDGGACVNDLLLQFQSDLLQTEVLRPRIVETTALGAAYLAGLATGFWPDLHTLSQQWQLQRRFSPAIPATAAQAQAADWQRALTAALAWAQAGG